MFATQRSSRQWFEEAVRCYQEFHQACPWCGGSHRVYQIQRGTRRIFSCQCCDFQATYDEASGLFRHIEGEAISEAPDTMFNL